MFEVSKAEKAKNESIRQALKEAVQGLRSQTLNAAASSLKDGGMGVQGSAQSMARPVFIRSAFTKK